MRPGTLATALKLKEYRARRRDARWRMAMFAVALVMAVAVIAVVSSGGAASTCADAPACLTSLRAHTRAAAANALAADADAARLQALASTSTSTTVPASTSSGVSTSTSGATTTTVAGTVPMPLGVAGPWTATFADEFTGTSLDRSKWNTSGSWECCDGGRSNAGNGELDYKTDGANFSFSNGSLVIQARRETAPGGQAWTSGQIASAQTFDYGYIETRAQFAAPKGFLNALWTWGAPGTNASAQETDAYEYYSDNHGALYVTSHGSGGAGCQGVPLGFDASAGMHTYGTDIESGGTTWYVDGVQICANGGHPTQPWNIVDYMTVNDCGAVKYRAPCADASTTSASYIIDYVRAWKR